MRFSALEPKDVSFLLAVKPYVSPKSQQILDALLYLLSPQPQDQKDILDPVAILNLLSLIKNLTQSSNRPTTQPPTPELPVVQHLPATVSMAEEAPAGVVDQDKEKEDKQ
ncbi:MAG: hypothetical protein ACOX3A_04790 [bacterium]